MDFLDKKKREGDFHTPEMWAQEARSFLAEKISPNWKDEYVVWDCSAGTLNLTKGWHFKRLYCSTLIQDDIDKADQMGYNPEAVKFHFDFLNDDWVDLTKKAPGLLKALNNDQPILFFINPPYATANNRGVGSAHKSGVATTTAVNKKMKEDGVGASSQQLYTQFLYRILLLKKEFKLSNVVIGLFSPPLFLTGKSHKKLRHALFKEFKINSGFIFPAKEFSELNADWGVAFSVLESGKETESKWDYVVKKNEIKDHGVKSIYNTDFAVSASDWVREEAKNLPTNKNVPQFTSAMKVKTEGKTMRGSMTKNAIGYFLNASNNIYENQQQVAIYSGAASKGNGFSIIRENVEKVCSLFSARKTHIPPYCNWINQKDEYLAPNVDSYSYKKHAANSLVYALFNTSSNQSSLDGIQFNGEKHEIRNHFFWEHPNKIEVPDSKDKHPTIVYELIENSQNLMSDNALEVLNISRELLRKTNDTRMSCDPNFDFQLYRWDAGFCQLKPLWKRNFPTEYEHMMLLYKKLEEELRNSTYESGFLFGQKSL